jgi:ABC-type phosphate/phosphonate transport system substrate-binding protein
MTRVATLGMYDHPAQHAANDRLWGEIARILRARGVADVPDRLDRTRDVHAIWRDPALLFGQACGYPLLADPALSLRVLALPVYDAPACGRATHASLLVARADDGRDSLAAYRGTRAAINDRLSNTGMNLFRATLAPIAGAGAFFADVIQTGAHRASVIAVGTGAADLAAIDGVTYAALDRFEPALTAKLKIVARSPESPTLPFVTAAATSIETVAALRIALDLVMADPGLADARAALFLTGHEPASAAALAPIAAIEATATAAGYPVLA